MINKLYFCFTFIISLFPQQYLYLHFVIKGSWEMFKMLKISFFIKI